MNPYKPIVKSTNHIKVVYLLDILFLLLILFMIYAINSKPSKSIELDLPKSIYGASLQTKPATISVLHNEVLINKILCKKKITKCLKEQQITPDNDLLINTTSKLSLQKFIHLMDQLRADKYLKLQLKVKQS
ncbi:MAG: biopolymer transporter ExbD [Candidatus Cloacimonetes bacterium]|nr:biopolymer transporter ExbD [Candidatus Cloacimonadota bacterium]